MLGSMPIVSGVDPHSLFRQRKTGETLIPQMLAGISASSANLSASASIESPFVAAFFVEEVKAQAIEQMQEDVAELVHQHKPEIVQTIVAQRKADDRRLAVGKHGRAIEIRSRQVTFDNENDAFLGQQFRAHAGPSGRFVKTH